MSEVRIVGGDFSLKGVHSKDDFAALTRVLQTGVSTLSHQQAHVGVLMRIQDILHLVASARSWPLQRLPDPYEALGIATHQ